MCLHIFYQVLTILLNIHLLLSVLIKIINYLLINKIVTATIIFIEFHIHHKHIIDKKGGKNYFFLKSKNEYIKFNKLF